jgi:hypothetical protein
MKNKKLLKGLVALALGTAMSLTPAVGFSSFMVYASEAASVADTTTPATDAALVQTEAAPIAFSGGEGTQQSPYLMSTVDDLLRLANEVNVQRKDTTNIYYKLVNDIDISSVSQWVPIGSTTATAFKGVFDGGNFEIRNFALTNARLTSANAVGFFGYINNATLKNIKLTQVNLNLPRQTGLAALVGYVDSNCRIENCVASGSVSGFDRTGGLINCVGGANNTIIKSAFEGTVTGSGSMVGGLIAQIANLKTGNVIRDTHATGTVSGRSLVGGLIGDVVTAEEVSDSYFDGTVQGKATFVGGLIGRIVQAVPIYNCYTTATVSGLSEVGGLVGYIAGSQNAIKKSHTNVTVTGRETVGGIIGAVGYQSYSSPSTTSVKYSNTLQDSYAEGKIQSTSTINANAGGLIGRIIGGMEIERTHFKGNVKAYKSFVGGLVGSDTFGFSSITKSYAEATVESSGNYVGGILGYAGQGTKITETYLQGSVSGDVNVGGIVGYLNSANNVFTDVSTTGSVRGNINVGGLIGYNVGSGTYKTTITTSYAGAKLFGFQKVNGVVGAYQNDNLVIKDVYFNKDFMPNASEKYGKGLTAEEMKGDNAVQNMSGFNFEYRWEARPDDYPLFLIR